MNILPVILCGGSGTRLWPVSRTHEPKQWQALTGDDPMMVETAKRVMRHDDCLPPVVICGASYASRIAEQFEASNLPLSAIIIEPMGRDTAAAAALAALETEVIAKETSGPVITLLLPSDHFIGNVSAFHEAISEAALAAKNGHIATLSIPPDTPATGFGYIRRASKPLPGLASFAVEAFVEKPDLKTAQTYLEDGGYSWNSGMFAFRPETFLAELERFEPDILNDTKKAFETADIREARGAYKRYLPIEAFSQITKKSVDFAVMERTQKAATYPANMAWSDVGSWAAMYELRPKDEAGNAVTNREKTLLFDTKNTLVEGRTDRLISAIGVENLAIVDTSDALLIADLNETQTVKKAHQLLAERGLGAAFVHDGNTLLQRTRAKEWAQAWFYDHALPFWVKTGFDQAQGGSYEALDILGRPIQDAPKRTRVQARQAYVYAHAAMLGFEPGREDLLHPLSFLLKTAWQGNGRLAHIVAADGTVLDNRHDTYDLAFLLLALAYVCKVRDEPLYRDIAEEAIKALTEDYRHPHGGFVEVLGQTSGYRRANPHMHMLEAALAWVELHGHNEMAAIADEIVNLYNQHFQVDGLLREYFAADLLSLETDAPGAQIEPGHLCEWAFLLERYNKLRGGQVKPSAAMLGFVEGYCRAPGTGLLYNGVTEGGRPLDDTTCRIWNQTEYIRLGLISDDPRFEARALNHLSVLQEVYLSPTGVNSGRWLDEVDVNGLPVNDKAPASILYHMFTMLEPLLQDKKESI